MKSLLKETILTLFLTSISFAQWFWQNPLPQGNNLSSVNFISATMGCAAGEAGTILLTTDGGTTWT